MRNLKIGILADGGDAGGGRRHILTLCENLPSATMSVCFFSLGEGALSHSIESLSNVPMKTHCLSSKLDKNLPKIILEWAEKENIDILHTHGLKANMYGRLALRKSKIPIITTYHSNPLYDYSSAIMGYFFSVIDQITLPMSSEYIGVSYEVATQLIRRGVQRNSISIVKNGVPLMNNNVDDLSSEHRDRIRKEYNIPKDAFVVGSLGRLVPVKGYEDTIAVFAEIKKRYKKNTSLYLLLIGGGEEEANLKELCRKLGIENSVIFAGFQKEPYPYILASDVMLFTPKSEALGIAILESMNAGRPVVSKQIGGIRELIINEYNGFIVKDDSSLVDSVIDLLGSEEKRNAFVKNGRKMIKQYFSNENMIQKTEAVYRSLFPSLVTICDISICGKKIETILELLTDYLTNNELDCKQVVTLNIEMLAKANKENNLKEAIQNSEIVVPDGTSVVKIAFKQKKCKISRIPGIELSTDLLEIANKLKKRVFFFGGKKEILDSLKTKISSKYPGITVSGIQDGYFSKDKESTIVKRINSSNSDILFVALGMGKQELFIYNWKKSLKVKIAIGVGGSFDVWSGNVQRSPKWWIDHNLEWFYRMIKQPKERIKRVLKVIPEYTKQSSIKLKPKRIVISGYYGFGNIGDEAILRTLMRDLKSIETHNSKLNISVFSANPYSTSTLTDAFAVERFSLFDAVKEIWRSDALISGGGGLIQDVTSFKSPLYYLGIIQIARIFRKPVFIYANGIGPLNGKVNKILCKFVLNQTNIITVRDEASKKILETIGVKKAIVTVDPIFSLNPSETTNIDSYLFYKDFIAVCFGPNRKTRNKCADIAAFLDYVIEKTELPVVFTPFYPYYDKRFSKLIQSKMKHPTNLINTFNTPEDMLSLLKRCKFGIGMRLHFMILLSLLNKPILPFIYDPKVKTFADILKLKTVFTMNNSLEDMIKNFDQFDPSKTQDLDYIEEVKELRNRNNLNIEAMKTFIESL